MKLLSPARRRWFTQQTQLAKPVGKHAMQTCDSLSEKIFATSIASLTRSMDQVYLYFPSKLSRFIHARRNEQLEDESACVTTWWVDDGEIPSTSSDWWRKIPDAEAEPSDVDDETYWSGEEKNVSKCLFQLVTSFSSLHSFCIHNLDGHHERRMQMMNGIVLVAKLPKMNIIRVKRFNFKGKHSNVFLEKDSAWNAFTKKPSLSREKRVKVYIFKLHAVQLITQLDLLE